MFSRPLFLLSLVCVAGVACGDDASSDSEAGSTGPSSSTSTDSGSSETSSSGGVAAVVVSGDAFSFALPGEPYGRIDGATVSVLEAPEVSATADAQGHFELEGLQPGTSATFMLERDGFPAARTKTFTLPESGVLDRVTFQVPDDTLFDLLAGILQLEVDEGACQIVSTITRVGKSIYDEGAHGEAEATVTIEPSLPAEHGPVYFGADVIPDPELTESSEDGGVLFTNVPPGTYTLRAHKEGVEFEAITMECAAGVLVNASPPYGLQALE